MTAVITFLDRESILAVVSNQEDDASNDAEYAHNDIAYAKEVVLAAKKVHCRHHKVLVTYELFDAVIVFNSQFVLTFLEALLNLAVEFAEVREG